MPEHPDLCRSTRKGVVILTTKHLPQILKLQRRLEFSVPKTVIERVPSRLRDIGISDVFEVPGNYSFTINDAIRTSSCEKKG